MNATDRLWRLQGVGRGQIVGYFARNFVRRGSLGSIDDANVMEQNPIALTFGSGSIRRLVCD